MRIHQFFNGSIFGVSFKPACCHQIAQSVNTRFDVVHVPCFSDVPLTLCFVGILLIGLFNELLSYTKFTFQALIISLVH